LERKKQEKSKQYVSTMVLEFKLDVKYMIEQFFYITVEVQM